MYPYIPIFGAQIPTFYLFSLAAFISCFYYYCLSERYSKLIFRKYTYRLFGIMIGAAIGGRALAFILYGRKLNGFFFMNFLNSGFVFYGGFLGGIAGLWISCKYLSRKEHYILPFLYWADMFATFLPLAQAIGRIGCFFNGCCYGRTWDHIPGILYPFDSKGDNIVYIRIFPTWFVESLFCLCLFLFLRKMWGSDYKYYYRGMECGRITTTYMLFYATFRFFLEFMRGDYIRGVYFGWLSTSQIISVIIIIVNIVFKIIKSYSRKTDCA